MRPQHSIAITRREWMTAAAVPPVLGAPSGPGLPRLAAAAQSSLTEMPVPDLVNIFPFIDHIAEANAPQLSFLNSRWKDLDEWKQRARPVFLQHLFYDPKPSIKAETQGTEERDDLVIERVVIHCGTHDIPARVLKPAGARGRLPGVLALHDHSGRYVWGIEKLVSSPQDHPALVKFRENAYGRPYAEHLARRGYVVAVIDAFYFGTRRLRPEEMDPKTAPPYYRAGLERLAKAERGTEEWLRAIDAVCSEAEHLTAKTIFAAGATWPGILVWDDRRTIDYLCTRPDVDSQRIGALGLSLGGIRTAFLIAADERVRASCVVGWMTAFRHQLRNHLRHHTWMVYVPGLYRWLDLPDAAALTAPGALLVLQCERDTLFPMSGMKAAVEKLAAIYKKAGIADRFRASFYDVPHSFNPQMQDEAFAWLDRWLKG